MSSVVKPCHHVSYKGCVVASLAMHDRSSLLNMLSMLSGKVSSCYARGVDPRRSGYRCGIEIDIAYMYNYSIIVAHH